MDEPAAHNIRPRLARPMHVGRGIGSLDDREIFKKISVPVKVIPMKKKSPANLLSSRLSRPGNGLVF
jgi:hypothetical protein